MCLIRVSPSTCRLGTCQARSPWAISHGAHRKLMTVMKHTRRYFVPAAVLIFACTVSPLSAQSAVGFDADIFAELLRIPAGVDGGSTYVVDETPLFPVQRLSDSEWQWFGPSTTALRAVAETVSVAPAGRFDSASFPPWVTLITRDVAQRFWGSLEEAIWAQFREAFKARSVWRFSRPVITEDGLDALVWSAQACGSMCGRTDVHWLHRASRADPWTIAKGKPKTVS
jgi:hypothetical protein